MNKQADKLVLYCFQPASKPTVQALLEKLRGTVPEPSQNTKSKKTTAAAPKSEPVAESSSGPVKRPKTAGSKPAVKAAIHFFYSE